MRVLLTGGAGFIGSHIAEAYRQRGYEVVVLDNFSTGCRSYVPAGVEVVEMDIRDPAIAEFLAGERFDAINHHAAIASVEASLRDPLEHVAVNVLGTVNLVTAAVAAKVATFIFASSGGTIYGEQDVHPCDEHHPTRPLTPYGASKLAAEHFINCLAMPHGMRVVHLRYGNVYGPRQNAKGEANVVAIFIDRLLRGETPTIYGDGTHTRDYVYVDDVVRINCDVLERPVSGSFNVGSGIERSVLEVYRTIADAVGVDRQPQFGPERHEQKRVCLDCSRAQKLLGWSPQVSFEDGIRRTVAWFREHGSR